MNMQRKSKYDTYIAEIFANIYMHCINILKNDEKIFFKIQFIIRICFFLICFVSLLVFFLFLSIVFVKLCSQRLPFKEKNAQKLFVYVKQIKLLFIGIIIMARCVYVFLLAHIMLHVENENI